MRLSTRLLLPALILGLAACAPAAEPGTPAYWVAQLADAKQRTQALQELGNLKDSVHIPAVAPWLQQKGPWQPAAAAALGKLGATQEAGNVIAAIDFTTGTGRDRRTATANQLNRAAARALGSLKHGPAAPILIKLLNSSVPTNREAALSALANIGGNGVAEAMAEVARADAEPFIRKTAIIALGNLGDAAGVQALIENLYREVPGISFYREARTALIRVGDAAVPGLRKTFARKNKAVEAIRMGDGLPVAEGAIEAKAGFVLGALRDQGSEPAISKALKKLYRRYQRRSQEPMFASIPAGVIELCFALEQLKPSPATIRLLGEIASEADLRIRGAASQALVHADPARATKALARAAKRGDVRGKDLSLVALSRVASGKGADTAERLARRKGIAKRIKTDAQARIAATRQCRSDRTCWAEQAKKGSPAVRERAVLALARLGATSGLMTAINDPDAKVRETAIWGLGDKPDDLNIDALVGIETAWKGRVEFAQSREDLTHLIARAKH